MINYSHDIHELLYFHSSGLLLQPDKCRGSFRRQREAKASGSWTLHVHRKVDKTEHHMAQKQNPLLQNQKDIYVSPGESTCPFLLDLNPFLNLQSPGLTNPCLAEHAMTSLTRSQRSMCPHSLPFTRYKRITFTFIKPQGQYQNRMPIFLTFVFLNIRCANWSQGQISTSRQMAK